uniref:Uncharacterized protein n=1 Tax=Timema monikensis TaxID=170555 RepID=A0A7R9HQV2_9NEOP|nr:unnamed protein product [Timema monikensis]
MLLYETPACLLNRCEYLIGMKKGQETNRVYSVSQSSIKIKYIKWKLKNDESLKLSNSISSLSDGLSSEYEYSQIPITRMAIVLVPSLRAPSWRRPVVLDRQLATLILSQNKILFHCCMVQFLHSVAQLHLQMWFGGRSAKPQVVLRELGQNFLHSATHCLVRNVNPRFSGKVTSHSSGRETWTPPCRDLDVAILSCHMRTTCVRSVFNSPVCLNLLHTL